MARPKKLKSKIPKTRMFGGKRYQLWGDGTPERSKKKMMEWADFQRQVNNYNARIVRIDGGYVPYMRKKR